MRNTDKNGQFYFFCPYCHRIQVMQTPFMDGFIDCTCRNRFYAYADCGVSLVMPADVVSREPATGAVHRFLRSIGDNSSMMGGGPDDNSRKRLVRALEEYQLECFGESRITVEVLDFVNNAFRRDKGVVLTNKKDDIDLREMAPPKRVSKPKRTSEPKGGTQKTAGSSPGTDIDNKLFENAV